jgi:Ca2+-binding EF-hand superfamily protein
MKANLLIAIAIALGCGIFANSAQASIVSFNMFDHNHDGRWDRHEFYEARRYYHHHGWRYPDFARYDLNHDGYLTPREVRAIRTW